MIAVRRSSPKTVSPGGGSLLRERTLARLAVLDLRAGSKFGPLFCEWHHSVL